MLDWVVGGGLLILAVVVIWRLSPAPQSAMPGVGLGARMATRMGMRAFRLFGLVIIVLAEWALLAIGPQYGSPDIRWYFATVGLGLLGVRLLADYVQRVRRGKE